MMGGFSASSSAADNLTLLAVTAAGAALCVLLAVLWPRRRLCRGSGGRSAKAR